MTLLVETESTADLLAEHVAARINEVLVEAQERRGRASVVLTGGSMGVATIRALAGATRTAEYVPDWSEVDIWWADEQFLPEGHPERNIQQAADAAEPFALMTELPPENVHVIGASDRFENAEAAAADYVAELETAARAQGSPTGLPWFDIALLGVASDGHVASIFPHHADAAMREATVIAVYDSPESPPTRVSMTLPLISTAEHVWFVASGSEKADAIGRLLGGTPDEGTSAEETPAGEVVGRVSTVLFTTPETLSAGSHIHCA